MSTLDDQELFPNPDEISARPTGIRYGVILALVGIAFQVVIILLGGDTGMENAGATGSLGCLSGIMMIVIVYMGIKAHRD